MPEPIQSPAPAAPDDKALTSILEGLGKLSDTVTTITERLDGFDETLEGIKTGAGAPGGEPAAPGTGEPAPAAPKWKPKTWDEIPAKTEEIATATVSKVLDEREKAKIQEVEDAKKQAETLKTQIDADFDAQFEALQTGGAIPEVKDVKDPNDEGKRVRKELFALGIKYNSPDLVAMAQLREEWVGNGYTLDLDVEHPDKSKWIKSNPSPFGATAPVGSSARSAPSKTGPTYKEIHNLSMDEMIRRYNA